MDGAGSSGPSPASMLAISMEAGRRSSHGASGRIAAASVNRRHGAVNGPEFRLRFVARGALSAKLQCGMSRLSSDPGRLWLLALLAFVPIAAVAILVSFAGRSLAGLETEPLLAVQIVLDWGLWAAAAPLIVLLVRRWPLDRPSWSRGIGRHLVISAAVALVELALFAVISGWVAPLAGVEPPPLGRAYPSIVSLWYPYAMLIYWVIAIGTNAVAVSRRERRRELETMQLREELTRAQLDALRMQLHPHFMGNVLNTVSVFVREGRTEEAGDLAVALGDLLNRALRTIDQDTVPLREELDFVRGYLAIEKQRFPERLSVAETIDPVLLDEPVPTMILQPLVENAMRHGIARDRAAGRIEIAARIEAGALVLTVRDDGPGPGAVSENGGHGLGLSNLSRRLERMYGAEGRVSLLRDPTGGARAVVRFPRRNPAGERA